MKQAVAEHVCVNEIVHSSQQAIFLCSCFTLLCRGELDKDGTRGGGCAIPRPFNIKKAKDL